jgi:hypothetical protein
MHNKNYTLSVNKKVLVILPGLMWFGVGIMLIHYAVIWIAPYPVKQQVLFYSAGFIAAMPIHHFGFLRIVDKNLNRLLPLTGKRSIFSFMTWKSYLIVIVMMAMGMILRHSEVPKIYLSILYNGIGIGLFLSGIRYFRFFIMLVLNKEPS